MKITIVPDDRIILINGAGLIFDYAAPDGLHALHYDTGEQSGEAEWDGKPNQPLTNAEFEELVKPFITAYETEKARLEEEAAKAKAEAEALYNSEEQRFVRLRAERDSRIAATDYLMTTDYPLTEAQREKVTAYRQALRDLPEQEGAPWDGGGEATPWPVLEDLN